MENQSANRAIVEITCPMEGCGHRFKMYRPAKSGLVKVTCPGCKQAFTVKVEASPTEDHSADAEKQVTLEPTADEKYSLSCPHCGGYTLEFSSGSRNLLKVKCPKCHGVTSVVIDRPAPPTDITGDADLDFYDFDTEPNLNVNAILRVVTKRRLLPDLKTDFPIEKNSIFIGRSDPDCQSDVAITGDTTVSRRSAQLEVVKGSEPGEYLYPFTVIKATNPVKVNGNRVRAGESVYLNFGDKIEMGKTLIVFMKGNHK